MNLWTSFFLPTTELHKCFLRGKKSIFWKSIFINEHHLPLQLKIA